MYNKHQNMKKLRFRIYEYGACSGIALGAFALAALASVKYPNSAIVLSLILGAVAIGTPFIPKASTARWDLPLMPGLRFPIWRNGSTALPAPGSVGEKFFQWSN